MKRDQELAFLRALASLDNIKPSKTKPKKLDYENSKEFMQHEADLQWELDYPNGLETEKL